MVMSLEDPIYNEDRKGAFTLFINGHHEVEVCYDLQKQWTIAHFEFTGPISETGYKSHFEPYDGKFPPTWEEWITLATRFAIHLFEQHGADYLNRDNVGTQASLL